MKKTLLTLGLSLLTMATLVGCGADKKETAEESKKIVVGATPAPHAEILKEAQSLMKEKGFELEIKEYNDYVQPNLATENGDLMANFFQHQPYLDQFNTENGTHLVTVASVHYEPFGIYAGQTKTLADLKDGDKVAVPNDTTNEARALLLLQAQGLIKLKEGAGLTATKNDILENPKKLEILEVEAAQLPHSLQDVNIAVINGNYALGAGLSVKNDALAIEGEDSEGASTYKNVLVVKEGNENNEAVKALVEILHSEKIKNFINEKYDGAVIPVSE